MTECKLFFKKWFSKFEVDRIGILHDKIEIQKKYSKELCYEKLYYEIYEAGWKARDSLAL